MVTSMWDGWDQQHEVIFEDTFQTPKFGLLNVLFPGNYLSILFKISKISHKTELEHKNFQILKLNERNKRFFRNERNWNPRFCNSENFQKIRTRKSFISKI